MKDSTYSMGRVLPLSNRRIQFQKTKKEEPIIYYAYDISEYGYNGKVFESLLINGEHKFVKRTVLGKVNLYQDKKLFVLKIDSSLTLLNQKNFRLFISETLSCNSSDNSLAKLTYSKASLSNYINRYNLNECYTDNIPYRRFGGYLGYNIFYFELIPENSPQQIITTSTPMLGLFYDAPIYKPKSLFLSTEVSWVHAKPLYYHESLSNSTYFGLTLDGINSLANMKWLFNHRKIKTYVKAGGLFSLLNISSPTGLILSETDNSVINISKQPVSNSTTLFFGFNSGIGTEVPLKNRNNLHLELSYLKSSENDLDFLRMSFSGVSIKVGFNI